MSKEPNQQDQEINQNLNNSVVNETGVVSTESSPVEGLGSLGQTEEAPEIQTVEDKKSHKSLIFAVIVLLVILLVGGGVYYFMNMDISGDPIEVSDPQDVVVTDPLVEEEVIVEANPAQQSLDDLRKRAKTFNEDLSILEAESDVDSLEQNLDLDAPVF